LIVARRALELFFRARGAVVTGSTVGDRRSIEMLSRAEFTSRAVDNSHRVVGTDLARWAVSTLGFERVSDNTDGSCITLSRVSIFTEVIDGALGVSSDGLRSSGTEITITTFVIGVITFFHSGNRAVEFYCASSAFTSFFRRFGSSEGSYIARSLLVKTSSSLAVISLFAVDSSNGTFSSSREAVLTCRALSARSLSFSASVGSSGADEHSQSTLGAVVAYLTLLLCSSSTDVSSGTSTRLGENSSSDEARSTGRTGLALADNFSSIEGVVEVNETLSSAGDSSSTPLSLRAQATSSTISRSGYTSSLEAEVTCKAFVSLSSSAEVSSGTGCLDLLRSRVSAVAPLTVNTESRGHGFTVAVVSVGAG
jgi:hypothetical protein